MGQRDKGEVTVLHAHDPLGPHIHHLASALRVRTQYSVEGLTTNGATIDLTMHTHPSLVRLAYSYTEFCGNRRRERTPPLKLGS